MKIRRLISAILSCSLLMCIICATAGCSTGDEDAAKKTKVVIWHSSGAQQDEALNEIVESFNKSQNKIEVIAESQPSANFMGNVYTAVANGVGPDIIFNFASTATDYIADKKVVDMTSYFDLDELKSLVPVSSYDECTGFEDGGLYCIPLHSSGPVMFYNKTIYDQLGLQVPTTWSELTENSKVIYDSLGIAGFAADSLTDLMQCRIMQGGSEYINVADKEVAFCNDVFADALDWYASNVRAGYFTDEKDGDYFYNNFNAGLVATIIASCGCDEYIIDDDFEYGIAPIPQEGPKNWYPLWNRALIVFSSNKSEEAAAVEFIKFFTNAENSAKWCIASGNISPYAYTADIDEYSSYLDKQFALSVVNDCKQYSTMLPTIPGSSTVRTELERAANVAIAGDVSIAEILSEVEKNCNDALHAE